jgi:SsrA-binding protein
MSLISNKTINLNYEIIETLTAGIELEGFEVKSLRAKRGSLEGAYILNRGTEVFLVNAEIPAYQVNNTPSSYNSRRDRKLLLTKNEALQLAQKRDKNGLTAIPISMYNKGRWIKVDIALAKGKKKHDKRDDLRTKEDKRHIERTLKNQY